MVSILNNPKVCPGTLTDTVHKLISLLSDKNVQVVAGPRACVNEKHTVFLPPLPKGATEKDFIKYFHLGTHEQAHIYGKSDFKRASKDKVHFKLENALEDVRCEQLQEKEYPGLKPYRIRFYDDSLNDFANEEFSSAEPDDIKGFIRTLGKFIIVKARMVQLDAPHLNLTASESLLKAYYAHVADLENRIVNMSTSNEMFELSGIIYDRLKDLIREDAEKKAQENKPEPQQGGSDEEDSQPDSSSSPDDEEESGSSGDKEEESDDSGDSSDPQGEDDSGSGTGEDPDTGDDPDTTNEDNDETPVETDQGSDEEDGDDVSDESEGVNGPEDDEPEEPGNDDPEDGSDGNSPSSGGVPEDDGDRSSGDDDPEVDPEAIEREVQKVLDDLNDEDDPMDITTEITQQVNAASGYESPYMVNPSVRDYIHLGEETTDEIAAKINKVGLQMLGPRGSQLTKIFISQTKPRTQYNRLKGTLDVTSLANDVHDTRDDLYRNTSAAKLDKAAVTFLIDNSSSMRDIIEYVYAMLSGILFNLSKACIPTEAIGYTIGSGSSGDWRDVPAILTIIKEFKESFNGKAMRRCAPPSKHQMGYTNDIDAIRFAVPRLWARPEKKKVIMVLCDGQPDMGNSELTRKVVHAYQEYIEICRKAGVIVFGIGLGVDLSHFFGSDCVTVSTTNVGEVIQTKLTSILNRGRA